LLDLSGCGGSEGGGNQDGNQSGSLSVSLSNASPLVFPAQSGASITATLTRTGTTGKVTLSLAGLPNGATVSVQSPGASNTGTVTVGAGTAPAGTYQAVVTASDGATLGSTAMTVTVGANTQVSNSVTGRLELTMSTSLQPAEWDYRFFTQFSGCGHAAGEFAGAAHPPAAHFAGDSAEESHNVGLLHHGRDHPAGSGSRRSQPRVPDRHWPAVYVRLVA